MSGATQTMKARLRRVIVIRQAAGTQWRVEGYERQEGQWRFTWLLVPATTQRAAQRGATMIAREMGLPVTVKPLGERMQLQDGVLGHAAWRVA